MSKKDKLLDIVAWVEVVVTIIVAVWIGSINHYKVHYEKAEPLSYQEARDLTGTAAGYPPGEDIPVAKSVEDIMENAYCTIEVSKENISSTRTFLIKDFSEAGDSYSKAGRKHMGSHVDERYGLGFDFLGDILYYTRQFGWNLNSTSYGEWCVVTLDSGEKIYVLVDLMLLDISSDNKIKLPIGEFKGGQFMRDNELRIEAPGQSDSFGILEENRGWYVDMVGDWEDTEVGYLSPLKRSVAFFFIAMAVCVCLELFVKRHRK